jgi:hypothetical protein
MDERKTRSVNRTLCKGSFKSDFVDSQLPGEYLQLAMGVFGAGIAVLLMIGEHQFQSNPPHLTKFFSMGFNFHTGLGDSGTGSNNSQTFDINETEPTGSVDAQLGMITEGRNVNADLAGDFQQVTFFIKGNLDTIDSQVFYCVNHFEQAG